MMCVNTLLAWQLWHNLSLMSSSKVIHWAGAEDNPDLLILHSLIYPLYIWSCKLRYSSKPNLNLWSLWLCQMNWKSDENHVRSLALEARQRHLFHSFYSDTYLNWSQIIFKAGSSKAKTLEQTVPPKAEGWARERHRMCNLEDLSNSFCTDGGLPVAQIWQEWREDQREQNWNGPNVKPVLALKG